MFSDKPGNCCALLRSAPTLVVYQSNAEAKEVFRQGAGHSLYALQLT